MNIYRMHRALGVVLSLSLYKEEDNLEYSSLKAVLHKGAGVIVQRVSKGT